MNEEVEVKDDSKKEPASEWLEPSPVGSEFMRHSAAMEQAARVPVHKAFAIAPGFNVGMLRKMAEAYKPKRIVVIDHEQSGFEVRRLGNNDDVSLFYASLNPQKLLSLVEVVNSIEEQKSNLKRIICEFLEAEEAQIIKYDAHGSTLRNAPCISYAYMLLRAVGIAVFRKSEEGASKAIHSVLSQLAADGLLRKLTSAEANELFETTATVYRINKGGL